MNARPHDDQLAPAIYNTLAILRSRIRIYVLLHGLMLALIWICLSYWVALAMDYLPVRMGFNEMPRSVRIVLLVLISAVLAWILYQWIFRRVFAQLRDQSLALVLERKFPELQDALVTVIHNDHRPHDKPGENPSSGPSASDVGDDVEATSPGERELLRAAAQRATGQLKDLPINEVFNFRPIILAGIGAVVLLISVAGLIINNPETFTTSLKRLYLLEQQQWPRHSRIEIVGIKVKHQIPADILPELGEMIPLSEDTVTVGQASDISLFVRAEAPSPQNPERVVPRGCEFRYRTSDGSSGVLPLNKIGGIRDGYQMFSLEGQVLNGILSEISFYVRGGDHRIGPFHIRLVPNPVITETKLHCRFPEYMVDEQSMRWTERTVPWRSGTKLPFGTDVTIIASANRPLSKVHVLDGQTNLIDTIQVDSRGNQDQSQFTHSIQQLTHDFRASYLLQDIDGVVSQRPRLVSIGMIPDAPPSVDVALSGIGSAVTPDVQIPIDGTIRDDYGVARAWIAVETPVSEPIEVDADVKSDGQFAGQVDFRQMRRRAENPIELPTKADSQLVVTVMASDHYNLDGVERDGHVGTGDRYVLDIVPPDRLLMILERLEAAQRRRLEQIYSEMSDARQYLVRSRSSSGNVDAGFEPGDQLPNDATDPQESLRAELDLRQLFVQRALLQAQKSNQEIIGVAEAFEDIRLQLINNRVDSEDRKQRLEQSVVKPLQEISSVSMQQLQGMLFDQDALFHSIGRGAELEQIAAQIEQGLLESITQTDVVLVQIQQVLDSLQKYETQNELLELVRRMIQDQQNLLERTKSERNRRAFEGLLKKQ